jgi:hypothetical protein
MNKLCLLYSGSRFEEQMLSIVMERAPAMKTGLRKNRAFFDSYDAHSKRLINLQKTETLNLKCLFLSHY